MTAEEIRKTLLAMAEPEYAAFNAKLIPNIAPETFLGVRTPALRSLAKKLHKSGDDAAFLTALPHTHFEENQLHAFLLAEEKDFDTCLSEVAAFLPFVDNWATCDQLLPKVFAKHADALIPQIREWLGSEHVYTVRFAVGLLMKHFLGDRFSPEYLTWAAAVCSEEYYINMMVAWYFAEALVKQYDAAVVYLTEQRLPRWVHNKTIQKAVESYRITPEQKTYLRTLKRGRE